MILSEIKKSLRITGTALDDVLQANIEACLMDLEDAGIDSSRLDNKVVKAVEMYCKWQMNFNGEADRYEKHYQKMSDTMEKQANHRLEG